MRLSTLLYMYQRRLRSHALQELLAGIGIAIAVALVFAAVLSQSSIEASASKVVHTVIGPASLQLRARNSSANGFNEAILARVQRLPGVARAAPLLEETVTVRHGKRQAQVELAGTDLRLATLDGLAETLPIGSLSTHGIGISATTARALGITGASGHHQLVSLTLRGAALSLRSTAVLGPEAAGALAGAYVAVMPLARMQQLARLRKDVSRIFVQTAPGKRAAVRRELRALAGGRLEVAAADQDIALLSQALGPSGLATGLFAAIGALLGFLLAFNAMLLTVAPRRRAIADLRVAGARRTSIVELVLFEALCLAIPASLIGLFAGYALSTGVFAQSTGYLAEAFTLSTVTTAHIGTAALAFGGGLAAACAASAAPLLDLRRGRRRDAIYAEGGVPGELLGGGARRRLAAGAAVLVAAASALWIALPVAAIAATALLALGTVLAVPLVFAAVLRGVAAAGERLQRLAILPLALASLRASTVRSLALAATGAVALFGSVALGGARQDLIKGIGAFAHSYVADAGVWVTNPGDNQAVESFAPGDAEAKLARLPGVAGVQRFQGGFLQFGGRRVWVIARPPGAERHVLASEIEGGRSRLAVRRLAQGGWVALSAQLAAARHVALGGRIVLPTPSGPRSFRVAATTSNLAWPPGVIFIGSADYSRYWHAHAPTALGIKLARGASPQAVRNAAAAALRPSSGLEVALPAQRAARIEALASEGLAQLQQVSTMLLIAAIVAMVAALLSSMWQRRPGLAALRLYGASGASLQAILMIEALLMLFAGCLTGAVAGLYGQLVIDGFLAHVTGFPLASPTTGARPLLLFALVLAAATVAAALLSRLASRVRPALALAGE